MKTVQEKGSWGRRESTATVVGAEERGGSIATIRGLLGEA